MNPLQVSRRSAVQRLGTLLTVGLSGCAGRAPSRLNLSTFSADVTVPIGHGMMGGAWLSTHVADPLEARGFVLSGAGAPVVFL